MMAIIFHIYIVLASKSWFWFDGVGLVELRGAGVVGRYTLLTPMAIYESPRCPLQVPFFEFENLRKIQMLRRI